jgi:hypothetical protein
MKISYALHTLYHEMCTPNLKHLFSPLLGVSHDSTEFQKEDAHSTSGSLNFSHITVVKTLAL